MWFYFLPRHVIMAMEYLHKLFHHIRVVAPKLVHLHFYLKKYFFFQIRLTRKLKNLSAMEVVEIIFFFAE